MEKNHKTIWKLTFWGKSKRHIGTIKYCYSQRLQTTSFANSNTDARDELGFPSLDWERTRFA